ncbi:hypothetical protein ACOSP7_004049 [Xanthoceras sorbifolium]
MEAVIGQQTDHVLADESFWSDALSAYDYNKKDDDVGGIIHHRSSAATNPDLTVSLERMNSSSRSGRGRNYTLSVHSLINKGFRCKKQTLAVLFLLLEIISFILDKFGGSNWSFLLASFLLSLFGFLITIYTSFLDRTIPTAARSEAERQLIVIEIVFSFIQLIVTYIHLFRAVSGVKSNNNDESLLPLAFAIVAIVFAFKNNEEVSGPSNISVELGNIHAVSSVVPIQSDQLHINVEPIGNIAERFLALCLKDSGVLYEDPYIQIGTKSEWRGYNGHVVLFIGNKSTSPLVSIQAILLPPSHLKMKLSSVPEVVPPRSQVKCLLEVINLQPSREIAVLQFSYKFGTNMVKFNLRLPAVLNKFLQPTSLSAEEFFPKWRSLSGPPLKLQEVIRGAQPMSLSEMANLLNSYQLIICPGLDPNPNNLVATTKFNSESTKAIICLIRIETDPADRTQLRMTVASEAPTLTFELKEFIKELLVAQPTTPKKKT